MTNEVINETDTNNKETIKNDKEVITDNNKEETKTNNPNKKEELYFEYPDFESMPDKEKEQLKKKWFNNKFIRNSKTKKI